MDKFLGGALTPKGHDAEHAADLAEIGELTIQGDPNNPMDTDGQPASVVNGGKKLAPGDAPQQVKSFEKPLPFGVKPAAGRDYASVFGAEPVPAWAKEMSNDAWNNISPALRAQREYNEGAAERAVKDKEVQDKLSGLEKQRYYDIADGWRVDPEISATIDQANDASIIVDHLTAQLENIENGQNYTPVVIGPDGKPRAGEPQAASVSAKIAVTNQLMQAHAQKNAITQAANQQIASFKSNQESYYKGMADIHKSVLGPYEEHVKPHRNEILQMFPPIVRHKPEILALTDSLIILREQGKIIKALQDQVNGKKANAPARAANPVPQQAGSNGNGQPDMKVMMRRLHGLAKGNEF